MKLPFTEFPEASIGNIAVHPPDVSSSSTFTRAHVFGVFLTLSICLLAQPMGSLLYFKPKRAFGRAVFFFWRLNPLACAAETFLVLYLVACMFRDAIAETFDPPTRPIGLSKRIHVTAAAIATSRGHSYVPYHWVLRVGSGRAKDDQEPDNNVASTSYSQAPQTDSQATQTEKSDNDGQCPVPKETLPPNQIHAAHDTEISILSLERKIMSRTLPAPVELAIDLVATIAIAFVTLTVFATTIPAWIRVASMCMVSNWAMVQLMVVLSRRSNLEAVDPTTLVQYNIRIKVRLHKRIIWVVLITTSLAIYCSIIYTGAKREDLTEGFKQTLRYQSLCIYTLFPGPWRFLFRTLLCFRRKNPDASTVVDEKKQEKIDEKGWLSLWRLWLAIVLCSAILVPLSCLLAHYLLTSFKACVRCPECTSQCTAAAIWVGLHCLYWFIIPMLHSETEWRQVVCSLWSLLGTAYIFTGAMMLYDTEATKKPDWLQWLGGPEWMTAG